MSDEDGLPSAGTKTEGLGVLGERMKHMQEDLRELKTGHQSINADIKTLGEKLASMIDLKIQSLESKFVAKEDHADKHKNVLERLSKIEANISWGVKIVVGAVLSALVGGVMIASKLHGG